MYLEKIHHTNKVFDENFCNNIIAEGESLDIKKAEIQDGDKNNRSSQVSWLDNKKLQTSLSNLVQLANDESNWNFSLKEFEPLQYSDRKSVV